ncbi:MAG: SpoIIE family protein phosphatase [Firmicutes bacterium]|nr:SpoIIE family protein phosphatase [Bacillota bacterium]
MERRNIAIEKNYFRKTQKGLPVNINKTAVMLSALSFFGARCEVFPLGSLPAFALAAAISPDMPAFLPSAAFVFIGILSKGYYAQIKTDLLITAVIILLHFALGRRKPSAVMWALTGGIICVTGKIFLPQIFRLTPVSYFSAAASGAGTFLLAVPFGKGLRFISKPRRKRTFSKSISLFVLSAFAICGLSYILSDVPLYIGAAAVLILMASSFGGAVMGMLMGMAVGISLSVSGVCQSEIFPVVSIFGLVSGLLREKGKVFSTVISAVVVLFAAAYYYPLILNFASGAIFAASCAVFLLLPLKNSVLFSLPAGNLNIPEDEHILKVKNHTTNLLDSAALGFQQLSGLFREKDNYPEMKSELSQIMTRVRKRTCKNCGMSAYCWERDKEKTKRLFLYAMKIYESKGIVTSRDFNEIYSDFCIYPEAFLRSVNKEFEIHERDSFWQMKLMENRYILKEELSSFAGILNDISSDISKNIEFLPELERTAEKRLALEGFESAEVSIWENADGSKGASLKMSGCSEPFVCTQKIIPVMNQVMGCRMRQRSRLCSQNHRKSCFLELESVSGMRIFAGACTWGKDESGATGDCYSVMDMRNKKILALADGMGYGSEAGNESRKVMELLELLIDSGLSEELSVRLINSSLVPQNTKENFSTLDVCVIDRITGSGYFLKAGASSAYIVRGNKIKAVKSSSLPIGIIAEASSENIPIHVKSGDIIIMVTDGVWDIIEKKGGDSWLYSRLKEINSRNPSSLSEYILNEARADAVPCETDDMTVLCAKIWGDAG